MKTMKYEHIKNITLHHTFEIMTDIHVQHYLYICILYMLELLILKKKIIVKKNLQQNK